MYDKEIFANNLKHYMELHDKSRNDMCEALGFSYFTFSDWVNAKKLPRMDKVKKMAEYFGITISDLVDLKVTEENKKDNDIKSNIIIRLRTDEEFYSLVEMLYNLDVNKALSVKQMLNAFNK